MEFDPQHDLLLLTAPHMRVRVPTLFPLGPPGGKIQNLCPWAWFLGLLDPNRSRRRWLVSKTKLVVSVSQERGKPVAFNDVGSMTGCR